MTAADDLVFHHRIEQFLYLEARLADESAYGEWLDLFDDEVRYWVPKGRADYDPGSHISFINDNRTRLETRIRQLQTGVRHAQSPPSTMRRVVANIEILERTDHSTTVGSNVVIREHSAQSSEQLRTWAGRATHELRTVGESFLIRAKTVELVNSERSLPTMAFLL